MNKLAKIIDTLGPKELALIQQDLQSGTLSKLVANKLLNHQKGPNKTCPVCGSEIPANTSFKLEFGSTQLRRQAHFDGIDCLTHFIENNLKKKEETQ